MLGASALLDELGKISGELQPAPSPEEAGAVAGLPAQVLTMKQYLGAQFRVYQGDAFIDSGDVHLAFWH